MCYDQSIFTVFETFSKSKNLVAESLGNYKTEYLLYI